MAKIRSVSHIFNQFWRPIFTFFSTHQQSKLKLACPKVVDASLIHDSKTVGWLTDRRENSKVNALSPRGRESFAAIIGDLVSRLENNGMIGRSPTKLTSWYSLTSQSWIVHCQYMSHLLGRHGLLVVAKVLDQSIKESLI